MPSSRRIAAASRGALRIVGGDADIERLALAHGGVERAHRLLERRLRIDAVRIEDVDIVEPHALQALVEAGEQIFAAAPFAIGARPHVVAGLGRDDQLVAIAREIGRAGLAESLLGRAGRRAVIVGEIEMGDAEIEGRAAHRRACVSKRRVAAEIVPEPERDRRQLQAAPPAAAVGHGIVARRTQAHRSLEIPEIVAVRFLASQRTKRRVCCKIHRHAAPATAGPSALQCKVMRGVAPHLPRSCRRSARDAQAPFQKRRSVSHAPAAATPRHSFRVPHVSGARWLSGALRGVVTPPSPS